MRPGLFRRRGWRGLLSFALALGLALSLLTASGVRAGPGELLLRLRADAPHARSVLGVADLDSFRAQHPELTDLSRADVAPLLPAGTAPLSSTRGGAPPPNPIARTFLVRLPLGSDAEALTARLRALPEVELAVPNRTLAVAPVTAERAGAPAATPPAPRPEGGADPRRHEQWYLDRVGIAAAWAVTRGAPEVLIAIVDTGVSPHPDLTPSLWPNDDPPGNAHPADDAIDQDGSGAVEDWERADDDDNGYVDDQYGYDFVDAPRIGGPGDAVGRDPDPADDSGHGTAVAGVVGAAAENGIGIAGLAPGCRLMIVRAGFNPGLGLFAGVLEEDDAAAGIVYAAENGAKVINLSFGDTSESPIVSDAVAYARALGAVVTASAGNDGSDGPHFPSALPGVIAVGASDFDDERAAFSSYGPNLDLVAPGVSILTTAFEEDYVALSGTSFSAPLVAAAAGLLLAHAPDLPPSQVEGALWGTAKDIGFLGFDLATGHGRLDAGRALGVPRAASVAIHAPGPDTGVDASSPIVLTAEGLGITSYVLDVGAGREPDAFTTVHTANGVQVVRDTVAIWDASELEAGEYTLRLKASDVYEGMLETRALVEVDHTPPSISELAIESLWVEDRLTPFVSFSTDDLSRGALAIQLAIGDPAARSVHGAYRTTEHTLRFPDDLPAGTYPFTALATNAAGLTTGVVQGGVTPVSDVRAMTHALAATGRALPPCATAPRALDLNQDGTPDLVVMLEEAGQTFGPLAVFGDSLGVLVERARLPHRYLPRDVGDSDADGKSEILASGAGTAVLLESPVPDALPSLAIWEDRTGFAIGFATLAGAPVILGIRSDSLLVWRATGDASSWTREAHANFAAPLSSLGPTFFVGDVDHDGADEVVVGDGEGNLLAFRETGSGLVPAYSLALGASASPLVAGGDLDLDGQPEVVASVPIALDATSEAEIDRRHHELRILTANPASGFTVIGGAGVAGAEPRGNGLRVANLDADSSPEILFLGAPDLYVFDRQPDESLFPIDFEPGFRSLTLAVADLDGDGRAEVFGTAGEEVRELEARDPSLPGPPPPAGLRGRIAADGAIELEWNPGGDRFRLYRAAGSAIDCASAPILVELTAPSYRDTTALALPVVTYRVSALVAGVEGECSAPLVVTREASPRLLSATAHGPRAVRVLYSAEMDGSASEIGSYALVNPQGAPLRLSSVISVEGERGRQLVLERDLAPGVHGVRVGAVRSLAGGLLAGPDSLAFTVGPATDPTPLHLVRALPVTSTGIVLELSAPLDPQSGSDPASFSLAGGFTIAEAVVESSTVRLTLDPATPLRPGAFLVQLGPGLRGARGERVVAGEGDRMELVVGGELVAYPNPYDAGRATRDGVTFAGLAAGDEIRLLDALGREVLRLDADPRGTAYLPVRGRPELASGVYLYRVEGPGGVRFGKLAIRR